MLPLGFINDGQHEEVYVEGGDIWGTKEKTSVPVDYPSSNLWNY